VGHFNRGHATAPGSAEELSILIGLDGTHCWYVLCTDRYITVHTHARQASLAASCMGHFLRVCAWASHSVDERTSLRTNCIAALLYGSSAEISTRLRLHCCVRLQEPVWCGSSCGCVSACRYSAAMRHFLSALLSCGV
jgi:hypothetical protein